MSKKAYNKAIITVHCHGGCGRTVKAPRQYLHYKYFVCGSPESGEACKATLPPVPDGLKRLYLPLCKHQLLYKNTSPRVAELKKTTFLGVKERDVTTITCAGGCGRSVTINTKSIEPCEFYTCNSRLDGRKCEASLPKHEGYSHTVHWGAAGPFNGHTFKKMTDEEYAAVARAKQILAAGLAKLELDKIRVATRPPKPPPQPFVPFEQRPEYAALDSISPDTCLNLIAMWNATAILLRWLSDISWNEFYAEMQVNLLSDKEREEVHLRDQQVAIRVFNCFNRVSDEAVILSKKIIEDNPDIPFAKLADLDDSRYETDAEAAWLVIKEDLPLLYRLIPERYGPVLRLYEEMKAFENYPLYDHLSYLKEKANELVQIATEKTRDEFLNDAKFYENFRTEFVELFCFQLYDVFDGEFRPFGKKNSVFPWQEFFLFYEGYNPDYDWDLPKGSPLPGKPECLWDMGVQKYLPLLIETLPTLIKAAEDEFEADWIPFDAPK
jgi:uncharacterized protein with HEPN domain